MSEKLTANLSSAEGRKNVEFVPTSLILEFFRLAEPISVVGMMCFFLDSSDIAYRVQHIEIRKKSVGPLFFIEKNKAVEKYNLTSFQTGMWSGVLADIGTKQEILYLIQRAKWNAVLRSIKKMHDECYLGVRLPSSFALYSMVEECAIFRDGIVERLNQSLIDDFGYVGGEVENADLLICMVWQGIDCTALRGKSKQYLIAKFKSVSSKYDQARLLSARLAEKHARNFYVRLGVVVDVSIQQLTGNSTAWKTHDLEFNGRFLDVKNSRPSFSGQGNYVEHCVPRFKRERISQEDVSIVGVISEYKKSVDELLLLDFKCAVLGEVSLTEARELWRWLNRRFGQIVDFSGMWNSGFLPGWIFEYSDGHYRERNAAIDEIFLLMSRNIALGEEALELPLWMYVLSAKDFVLHQSVTKLQRSIFEDLLQLRNSVGLNRRSLYLYVLGVALEAVIQRLSVRNVLDEFIALTDVHRDDALGYNFLYLKEPQGLNYISALIGVLNVFSDSYFYDNFDPYIKFKMTHPLILRAQRQSGAWETVVAYCGGWRKVVPEVPCGNIPLVVGRQKVCTSCGNLVCDSCGFCKQTCVRCEERQKEVAGINGEHIISEFDDEHFSDD